MNGAQGGNLQNVLSISTAANNRYLLHFNSLNSLTQWTAGIRLAMFEHSTLQEAYTGSLIAGKGRFLNNIKAIMERSRFPHEDWTRVRFGAGTAWKRCWCVVTPPDEKEFQKAQKTLKKTSAYERVKLPKGDIRFYDTRKVTKKTRPIATITDAFAAYAIYPQSKPLIDQSTLVKLEGLVTIHGSSDSVTEGFVFVMPEVHPAVTGFEMMLRFLFPVFDTFGMYGRPNRLIADTLDQRGLMFAMPRDRRYGYLDILDVSALLHTKGSQAWSERQWRREMKKLTASRMTTQMEDSTPASSVRMAQRRNTINSRTSTPAGKGSLRFDETASIGSAPGSRSGSPVHLNGDPRLGGLALPKRTDSAPPDAGSFSGRPHRRAVSDVQNHRRWETQTPSRLSFSETRGEEDGYQTPLPPPRHSGAPGTPNRSYGPGGLERILSGDEVPTVSSLNIAQSQDADAHLSPPAPVTSPPAFTHSPNSRPSLQPTVSPELRRAHSNVDAATLYQMQEANRPVDSPEYEGMGEGQQFMQQPQPPQHQYQNSVASTTLASRDNERSADRSQGTLNDASSENDREARQRLSPIPGSPFVGASGAQFESQKNACAPSQLSSMAGVDQVRAITASPAPSDAPLRASHSIARKPLPGKMATTPARVDPLAQHEAEESCPPAGAPGSPQSPINNESVIGDLVDGAALERILNGEMDSRTGTMVTAQSSEPDYASTVSDHEPKKSTERPRTGKLKVVGDPDMPPAHTRSGSTGKFDTWEQKKAQETAEVPLVDFGPTLVYHPTTRPGTGGTIPAATAGDRSRSRSGDRLSRLTPTESRRHSYFGSGMNASPGGSGGPSPARTPGDRRSLVWPRSSSPAGTTGEALTPEEWVQQRAAAAAQPQHPPPRRPGSGLAHYRTASGNSGHQVQRSNTRTPPFSRSRTPSGDWTQYMSGDQRTPPSRPQSRGANVYLGQAGGSNMMNAQATNLSAKEQMHVARATGTPMINYTTNADKKKQEQHQPGLFGALAAREREREESNKLKNRYSMNNQVVQQAVAARHQQQAEAEERMRMEYQMKMQQQAAQQAFAAQQTQAAMMQQLAAQQVQMQQQIQYQQSMMGQSQAAQSAYGIQGGNAAPSVCGMQAGQAQSMYVGQQMGAGPPGVPPPAGGFSSPIAQKRWEGEQAVLHRQSTMSQGGAAQVQWPQQQERP